MRILKAVAVLSAVVISASLTFASDIFYETNSDLRRVGLDEIRAMSSIGFESGNYRLDPDFRLGYGDTLTVNFWGKLEASHEVNIDRDGNIVIPLLGKVSIIGLTLAEARAAIQRELDNKYTNVELDLNLADVQDIRVAVLGYITKPGPYAVSPFCRIVEVIAKAGGPNKNGSLSDIRLIRDEKVVASFNAYDFIFKGDQSQNARVKNGDLIYIPETKNLVAVRGDVRYPGIYEADSSTLSKVISIAGGITPTNYRRKISILRIEQPVTGAIKIFKDIIFEPSEGIKPEDDITLENYDSIIITSESDFIPAQRDLYKTVDISGEIENPGIYLIKDSETLSSLLKRAGGPKKTAFIQGTVFTRDSLKESQESILNELTKAQEIAILKGEAFLAEAILTQQEKEMRLKALEYKRKALNLMAARPPEDRIIINLQDIIEGKSDIILEKEDRLYIPPVPDWVMVTGAVYSPKSIAFVKGEAAGYYINAVGGPTKFADDDIYIIKASGRTESKSTGYGVISRGDIIVIPAKAD